MKAIRRNITVTSEIVDKALDASENASKFIEKCVLFYLDESEKKYVTDKDLQELFYDHDRKMEILNNNYLRVLHVLDDISKILFQKGTEK